MPVTIIKTGEFFDVAAADIDVAEGIDQISRAVALQAFRTWNILLEASIRVNRYRYMSGNRFEPRDGGWVVHDDIDKPYGPWLEGVGSRNGIDGFPGYHALADAAEQTRGEAEGIADEQVAVMVAKLNVGPG